MWSGAAELGWRAKSKTRVLVVRANEAVLYSSTQDEQTRVLDCREGKRR
jgi:hypothetical protein